MRQHFSSILLFAVLAALIPLIALNPAFSPPQNLQSQQPNHNASSDSSSSLTQENNEIPANTADSTQPEPSMPETPELPSGTAPVMEESGTFSILDESSGKLFSVSSKDFIRGALAAEMPPTFHPEALKAQAVAAHTYALCVQAMQKESPDPALKGADLSADPENWKSYTTEKIFRQRYGNMADAYWKAITDAADQVADYIMVYDNRPIVAAYHSMNTGMTEDASNVWTGNAPYLVPVESRGDALAPDFQVQQDFPAQEVKKALESLSADISLGDNPQNWIAPGQRSPSGYILTVNIGGKDFPAKDLRTLLGLRSTSFLLNYANDTFSFTVQGYGHGVGLSQYGADWYARQGMDFAQILSHYYPTAELGIVREIT